MVVEIYSPEPAAVVELASGEEVKFGFVVEGKAKRLAGGPTLVPAVTRALTVLDRLAQQRGPMSLARLAADLALPKSSVHGVCSTLVSFGYLPRQNDGRFLIGPRGMELASARRHGWSVDDQTVREGVYSFGAPVFDASGQVIAGVAVCINKALLGADKGKRHRQVALDVARTLSQRLGGDVLPVAAGRK